MDWSKLLKAARLAAPDYQEQPGRPAHMVDIDRITFSAPFRRLANKTQVHPLYDNDHVHHRLIHSVEVANVGRSLGMLVGQWLVDTGEVDAAARDRISGVVQAACLAHDIGNPPFGHSGEAAIGSWFAERFEAPRGVVSELAAADRQEFTAFEGNAQGFRILTRTEMSVNRGGMRLSLGVLGAFTKYPCAAHVSARRPEAYCGLKKFGVFNNDISTFKEIAEALELPFAGNAAAPWWRRHPLVFLMEAADDICYNIMDLEDAFISGDVAFEQARALLSALFAQPNREYAPKSEAAEIAVLRAIAVHNAIDACVEAFKTHYDALMAGTFDGSLIEASSKAAEFAAIKDLARARIFKAARKTELEVFGRNVIYRALDGLIPLLDDLAAKNWDASRLSGYHQQLARAVNLDLNGVDNAYDALHVLTDFVSGMTDRYAVKTAEMLYGR
ncbi:MAG TPA: dNTP triphosphohydrolase [Asticcacaulis sp.]